MHLCSALLCLLSVGSNPVSKNFLNRTSSLYPTDTVMAHHWEEEPNEVESVTPMTLAVETKRLKMAERNRQREAHATANNGGVPVPKKIVPVAAEVEEFKAGGSGNSAKQMKSLKMVREHINLCKSRMRNDPRPIDSTCGCYTCKGYSRAYLHHLFKAKETLGGTLVSPPDRPWA